MPWSADEGARTSGADELSPNPFPVAIDSLAQRCIAVLGESGISSSQLARAFGISPKGADQSGHTLPYGRQVQFFQAAAAVAQDPLFGLRIGKLCLADLQLVGQLALKSQTVGDALRAIVEFQDLLTDGSRSDLEIRGPEAAYKFKVKAADTGPCDQIHLIAAQGFLQYLQELTGPTFQPTRIVVGEVAADLAAELGRRLGAPVRCGGAGTAIVFPRSVLDRPLLGADPRLARLLRTICERELDLWRERSAPRARIEAAVKACIVEGLPSVERVADRLGVKPATLLAQLKAVGTTHREFVDGIRRNLAEDYLTRSDLSLIEISQLLGYAEPAAFNHAFQRWTGVSPRKRRQHLQELAGGLAATQPGSKSLST